MRRLLSVSLLVALSGLTLPQRADAQQPVAQQQAPDAVLLKNGGLLRGTISELIPGKTVSIVLVGGGSRSIDMSEVTYAGPASGLPSTPAVSGSAGDARVRLVVTDPESRFHRRTNFSRSDGSKPTGEWIIERSSTYEDLCGAPCEFALPAGTHTFALSKGTDDPVDGAPVTIPAGTSTVEGTYISHSARRWIVSGLFIGGIVGGLTVGAIGASEKKQVCDPDCRNAANVDWTLVGIGTGLIAAATIGFLIFGIAPDEARFRVIPAVSTSLPRSLAELAVPRRAETAVGTAPGLTLATSW